MNSFCSYWKPKDYNLSNVCIHVNKQTVAASLKFDIPVMVLGEQDLLAGL